MIKTELQLNHYPYYCNYITLQMSCDVIKRVYLAVKIME